MDLGLRNLLESKGLMSPAKRYCTFLQLKKYIASLIVGRTPAPVGQHN